MAAGLLREIIPLTKNDCFTIFSRTKDNFDFPLHYHEEFELNFIQNAKNAQRIIGDHIEAIGDLELVLVGTNLQHGWFNHQCKSKKIKEITVQFHRDLFDEKFLNRNQMHFIKNLLEKSLRGVLFSQETIKIIEPRLFALTKKQGFDSVLELMSLLHDLSVSRNMRVLSNSTSASFENFSYGSRRIENVMDYIAHNFSRNISLTEAARIASMTNISFSRFFKLRTGRTFIDTVNEIRLGHASRMLIDTTNNITEVGYKCGFNNISNFNRIFRKKKGCTPKEFREAYNAYGTRYFI
ncbi:MAG: helix-turn-helix domain-containing protein [Bacteroidetes bacterium]|nr:helix-turn-helix domain-containing protein [Bacteroidota bacterium]